MIVLLLGNSLKMVPEMGALQGALFYKWADFLSDKAQQRGVRLHWLNLDETWVPKAFSGVKGNVTKCRRLPSENIPLNQRRGGVTLVGMVASTQELQSSLPSIVLAGNRVLKLRALRAVSAEMPTSVQVWRGSSSWNCAIQMENILELIAAQAANVLGPTDQIALVMDCCAIHICRRVLQKARSLNIWVLLIPAKCTHVFQPADTHLFSNYKSYLRQALSRIQIANDGVVSQENWLRCIFNVCNEQIAGKRWQSAFVQNGILGNRSGLSTKLKAYNFPLPAETAHPPTFDELVALMPKAAQVWYWDLFGGLLEAPPALD